ncbi:MAG TPA: hypothetical protein VGM19_04100 [Armatimonadota bacterium]|jgi:hypothetical protein
MRHLRLVLCLAMLSLLAGSAVYAAPVPAAARPQPAILLLNDSGDLPYWAVPTKLHQDYGFSIGVCGFQALTWDVLKQYNAVIVFDMSRLLESTRDVNAVEISPEGFQRISDLLYRFAQEGGGLYLYGVSFTHMGQGWAGWTLNKFLQPLGAQALFESLRDEPREQLQPEGQKVLYARADQIVAHPATAGVKNWWYPVGPFSYGPWTRALVLDKNWTPLIRTSPGFKSTPVDDRSWGGMPLAAATSGVTEPTAVVYAARSYGSGRVIFNGSESTISFFGYGYSPYADRAWGRVGMEAGLNGIKSDGWPLLVSSLKWLVEPSVKAGNLGGYVEPPPPPFKPDVAAPIKWEVPAPIGGVAPYKPGVIGAMPAVGGGSGTVAEYVTAAQAKGLSWLVCVGDFAKMDKPAWDLLVADCKAACTAEFVVVPALLTHDDQNNSFLQCSAASWPLPERLSKKDPKRVQDHLGYWMNDGNFPCRIVFNFSAGQYPAWLHSGYDTFAVRTYQDGKLIDEAVDGFLQNQEQGDRSRIVSINLLSSPAQLANVTELTYIMAGNAQQMQDTFCKPQFSGDGISYVSSGPQIVNSYISNVSRGTFGQYYVPGTERWRASLKITSPVPLKSITFYDSTRVFRRYALTGTNAEVNVEGLHDMRHVLCAVIEDEQGRKAMTGSSEIQDQLMAQYFCSDRCNIMSGQSSIRQPDGHVLTVPASSMLYKAGRLYYGAVALAEGLPGMDGSGGATEFSVNPNMYMEADNAEQTESRLPLHRIMRPWEAADGLVFDTPILKRSAATGWVDIFGHNPYVDLAEPKIAADLTQWHFYKAPLYPATVMAELSETVLDPAGVQLKTGWNGFSQQWTGSWSGTLFQYMILRVDGTHEQGPSADEKVQGWRGTLNPGDAIIFPTASEGMYVLEGRVDAVIESVPSKKWFRLYLGRFDTPKLAAGDKTTARVLNVKFRGAPSDDPIGEFSKFRDLYGIAGQPPAYSVTSTQGKPLSGRYLLQLQADKGGWAGTLGQAALPQRLPVAVTGVNPQWTVAKLDLTAREWFPLGVWKDTTYTTVDLKTGPQKLYVGNVVTCNQPEMWLTLLPANADGKTYVEAHNPTAGELTVQVTVPVASFLAAQQTVSATVPAGASVRLELKP